MGLSGRKTKQRIPNDPRNLAWANDANKFGAAYLAKFGWDPSSGLGVSGEGRTKALSVHQKLDMLGIGADHKNSAEGLAWKQNKDFESLLRRLNATNGGGEEETRMKIDGFTKGADMTTIEAERMVTSAGEDQDEASAVEERRSKKKRNKDADAEEGERKKKKSKKKRSSDNHSDSEGESQAKKKSKKGEVEVEVEVVASTPLKAGTSTPSSIPTSRPAAPSRHPRAAFRARHMAAKSRASTSATALAEILGIADSGSATPLTPSSLPTSYPPTPFEAGPSTSSSGPSSTATPAEEIKLQDLTVSSKSVMDYFKEKLAAKSRPSSSPSTPALAEEADDYDERPRMGLGASRLRQEASLEVEERRGLGGIGSGSRLSFASMFTSATVMRSTEVVPEVDAEDEVDEDGESTAKKSKVKKDKERKKEKKSKKEKGKEKELDEAEDVEESRAAADEKAERKRRKEEKRRRKEAEAQPSATAGSDAGSPPSLENRERKEKNKKKRKTDR
ncbi:hypothetical protein LXA43DRAFT_979865 [Ganoderma leucocontextum]|nr:hypothetical protein LXA43DRAFT_979865 [Ganoderma leucocontextum]